MIESNCFREDLRAENFVPWDITGQRYSREHVLLHILYYNGPKLLVNDCVKGK